MQNRKRHIRLLFFERYFNFCSGELFERKP